MARRVRRAPFEQLPMARPESAAVCDPIRRPARLEPGAIGGSWLYERRPGRVARFGG
jgi:hypothetical protein